MALKAFTFEARLTDLFVDFGYQVNREDPAWIPPFRQDLGAQLSAACSFHRQPGNDHRRFLALAGAAPRARCLASVNRELRDRDGTPVGAIGFFESSDDYAAAEEVLAAASLWLRESHGIRRIWGPLDFDIWHGYRFMTRGFERRRFQGEPYNKPYYPGFFERFGFAPRQRWNTLELDGALARVAGRGGDQRHELLDKGYRFEPFDVERFDASVVALHQVLTRSFCGFLGYTPIALADFQGLLAGARHSVHAECSTFVYDEHGALAGFAGVFFDLADALRAMQGGRGALARLRFLLGRRRATRLMLHVGGVTPEEAAKRNGVARGAFDHVIEKLRAQGCETVLATLIAKGNPVRRLYREYAADERREYALYEKNL